MRTSLLVLGALASGCGGVHATTTTDWDFMLIGRYRVEHLRRIYPDHGAPAACELLDGADRSKVLARVEHCFGEARFEANGNRNVLALETLADGHKAWALIVYDEDEVTHQRTLVAFPPALRKVSLWYDTNDVPLWAVAAGSEDDLVLPIDGAGRPVWFPEGVVGVKPIFWGGASWWAGWLVRWKTPTPGWSVSFARDLSDVALDGARWTSLELRDLPGIVHAGYTGLLFVEGRPPTGGCEAFPLNAGRTGVDAQPTLGATCELATGVMLERYEALQNANDARLAAITAAQEAARRAEAEVRQNAADAAARADLLARSQYEQLVLELPATATLPAEACTLARSMSFVGHRILVSARITWSALLVDELACLRGRASSDQEQRDVASVVRQNELKLGIATATTTTSAPEPRDTSSYSSPGDDAISRETRATEARTEAMRAYTYGRGGVCPFDAYLCP